ncbi:hypothetical protein AB1Y20_008105 [Prymnesium parvum]|uniref:sphinganine-1-phosphate aldolase n=1 Tax=Prymnesium parvum TaxID=97485 RepID=A0AB34ISR1_PRYPA
MLIATSPLRQADETMRRLVNGMLHGMDPYGTLKFALLGVALSRLLTQLRDRSLDVGVRSWLLSLVLPWVKRLPFVRRRLAHEAEKVRASLEPTVLKDVTSPCTRLPFDGLSEGALMRLIDSRREIDTKYWKDGMVTGAVYHGQQQYMDFIGKIYGMFAFTNPLHVAIHPATRQMEAEVIQMVINLYHGGPDAVGAFTTGGTESILMAMKAYRDYGREKRGIRSPNIVASITAHAAFDKAAQYFGIQLRHARVNASMEIDLDDVRRLVDANTVAIVGSAPQFPHGTVDPIEGLARIATARGCGLHVDCCLGGFLLPFMEKAGFHLPCKCDFRVRGVTSVSCDPHKYGFAPKGASIVMFSSAELRHSMYTFVTEWTGGIYATPTILGSRPGGVVAATWAALRSHGFGGYVETTRQIVGATKAIGEAIKEIDGIELVGRTDVCVVAFRAAAGSDINIYSLCDAMKDLRGWDLATLQNPPAAHLALTLPSSRNATQFSRDLLETVATLRADKSGKYSGGTAGIYGMCASLPASFIEESVKVCLDIYSKATPGVEENDIRAD